MRHRLALPLATLLVALWSTFVGVPAARAQDAIFLVRHAERQDASSDSPLSADGRARAARLAAMLRDARIGAIYVTQWARTLETAKPLAASLKLEPIQTPAGETTTLVAKIRAAGAHARVLVVAHSDTVPEILKAFGYERDVALGRDEYDNLFVIVPGEKERPVVLQLRY
jgi:broad specificity phosphatase PhoE